MRPKVQRWGLCAALSMLSGCSLTLHLYGGELVNPLDPQRFDPEHNSQELAIRVYQLKGDDKVLNILWISPRSCSPSWWCRQTPGRSCGPRRTFTSSVASTVSAS
jgi:hypothetical protein